MKRLALHLFTVLILTIGCNHTNTGNPASDEKSGETSGGFVGVGVHCLVISRVPRPLSDPEVAAWVGAIEGEHSLPLVP